LRKSLSTQVSVVPGGATAAAMVSSSRPNPNGGGGLTAWNVSAVRSSGRLTVQVPRSRPSMTWIGSAGSPGASTCPPRAMRSTHQVNR